MRTISWEAAYQPFGQAQVKTGTVQNNLRFPGQYFDSETGLHYNWHRFYDPETGRYLSADPIGLDGGMNLYSYVENNPVNWVDPNGLTPSAGAGAAAGTAIGGPVGGIIGGAIGFGLGLYGGQQLWDGMMNEGDGETSPVDKNNPPNHPDFTPHKKKPGLQKIPWNKDSKGWPDKNGNYWEPVPDGHKGTHDPHWDCQHPDGSHTPKYPPK